MKYVLITKTDGDFQYFTGGGVNSSLSSMATVFNSIRAAKEKRVELDLTYEVWAVDIVPTTKVA